MSSNEFFESPQGAAIMKHTLLKSYIRLFVNKLGSTHATVCYLDGYAGPGVYGDGSHGSPKLAADVAALVEDIRDLRCTFVEKDKGHADALTNLLSQDLPSASVIQGDLADHIEQIAKDCDKHPLLAFIDPFGLGVSLTQLERLVRRTNDKTDIIMNVSLSALRRNAGHLTSTSIDSTYLKARKKIVDRMDNVLGGDWWHEVWIEAQDEGASDGAHRIAYGYADRCKPLLGGYFMADVKDRWDGATAYMLMLLSGHPDAYWGFNEGMSIGYDKLRELDPAGQLISYQDDYPAVIRENILNMVDAGEFVVGVSIGEVYGPLLGTARGTHLRPVIKTLCTEGLIEALSPAKGAKPAAVGGKGDLQRMKIKAAGS